jgi:hypothetical protein
MITKQVIDTPSGKNITLEILDARTIVLTTTVSAVAQYPASSGKPTELHIGDDIYVDVNSPFKQFLFQLWEDGPRIAYNIKTIVKVDTGKYLLHTHDRTVSSYFLTPMLGFDKHWFEWDRYFINAYFVKLLQTGKTSPYKYTNGTQYVIGILVRFLPINDFIQFEHKLKKHPLFLFHYDMDYQTSLLIFKPDPRYNEDMQRVSESRYSKLSEKLKSEILRFHNFPKEGEMDQILNRSEIRQRKLELELRGTIPDDVDLLDRVDFSKELITINDYK